MNDSEIGDPQNQTHGHGNLKRKTVWRFNYQVYSGSKKRKISQDSNQNLVNIPIGHFLIQNLIKFKTINMTFTVTVFKPALMNRIESRIVSDESGWMDKMRM